MFSKLNFKDDWMSCRILMSLKSMILTSLPMELLKVLSPERLWLMPDMISSRSSTKVWKSTFFSSLRLDS